MFYWRFFNRPRHPLLRLLLAALGAVLLVGILIFGFFALIAFAFIGTIVALTRALTRPHSPSARVKQPAGNADPQVIEGEFVVVHQDTAPLHH
jgi:hypothetical protein